MDDNEIIKPRFEIWDSQIGCLTRMICNLRFWKWPKDDAPKNTKTTNLRSTLKLIPNDFVWFNRTSCAGTASNFKFARDLKSKFLRLSKQKNFKFEGWASDCNIEKWCKPSSLDIEKCWRIFRLCFNSISRNFKLVSTESFKWFITLERFVESKFKKCESWKQCKRSEVKFTVI